MSESASVSASVSVSVPVSVYVYVSLLICSSVLPCVCKNLANIYVDSI